MKFIKAKQPKLVFKHKRRTQKVFIKNHKSTKEQLRIKKSIYNSYRFFPYKDNLFWYYRIQIVNCFFLSEPYPKELNNLEIIIHEKFKKLIINRNKR